MKLPCGHLFADAEIQVWTEMIFVRCPSCIGEFWPLPAGTLHCVRCGDQAEDALCPSCERELEDTFRFLHRPATDRET